MKPKWIIDKHITDRTSYENLENIIRELGYDVSVMQYIPFKRKDEYELPYNIDDCVIVYGTIDFVRKLPNYFGTFLNENSLKYHKYTSNINIPSNYFLNDDFIMTTYYDFKNNFEKYANLFGTDALFIRPDSGLKVFTGLPIFGYNYKSELNALDQLSSAVDDTLIIVAKQKKIYSEARYIIAGDKVIDGSRYKIADEHFEDKEGLSPEMTNLVEMVAKANGKPEEIFTCDIANTQDGPKIIELNSFSSAGWYACDPYKIVKEVSNFVEDLYKEQYE